MLLNKLLINKKSPIELFISELLKKNGDIGLLNKMLEDKQVNINYKNSEGEGFLHLCLKAKRVQNALWLISKNIKLDTIDKHGITPFILAVTNQYHRVVRIILDKVKVVELNKKNEYGRTLLQDSVILGDHEMAKMLIESGADLNILNNKKRNVFYDALSYNNEDFINYILDLKKIDLNTIDTDHNTLFAHKAIKENTELAKKLIENGANPTIINKDKSSYLYHCALNGVDGLELIHLTISKGFDVNSNVIGDYGLLFVLTKELSKANKTEDERKVLRYMIKDLITKGLDVNKLTASKETVLFQAVRINDLEFVKLLLHAKIRLNVQNNKLETALSIAVYQGITSIKIIVELLKHHADPVLINEKDKTLFEEINDSILNIKGSRVINSKEKLDRSHHNIQLIKILKELLKYHQDDLDYLDSTGNPLFYKPLMYNNTTLFYLYVNKGLNIHKLNKHGHNLFFEYVLKVFKEDNEKIDFQAALNILVSAKINHNIQDQAGWTVISKVIATTPCNLNLFKTLIKVVKFDYTLRDKLGRTAMHSAVWKNNAYVTKVINFIDPSVKDIIDNYGMLPITYAAVLGNKELVQAFISIKAKVVTEQTIIPEAIKKFTPLLTNLKKLTFALRDQNERTQVNLLIENIKKDFRVFEID